MPYKVDKKYTGCSLKTTELLDCVLIWECAAIRSNMVCVSGMSQKGSAKQEASAHDLLVFIGGKFVKDFVLEEENMDVFQGVFIKKTARTEKKSTELCISS